MARGTGMFDGEALRRERQRRGLSAARLGARIGTSKSLILAYESGKHVPEPGRTLALAEELGVHITTLVPWRDPTAERTLGEILDSMDLSDSDFRVLMGFDTSAAYPLWRRSETRIITIAMLRRRQGLTVVDTAEKAGMALSTYRRIEQEAMLPARGRSGVTTRLSRVLGLAPTIVQNAIDLHPHSIQRQFEVSQLLAKLMGRYCGTGSVPAVQEDDPDLMSLSALIRQPRGPLSRIVDQQLAVHQRRLREKIQYTLQTNFPENAQSMDFNRKRLANLDNRIRQAPYRAAAIISKFLSDGLTSRQWKSLTNVMARLAVSERPEAMGVSAQQEPDLWPALMGLRHEGRHLIRESSLHANEPLPGPGKFYYFTESGFRYYEAARLPYEYLYPRVYAIRFPRRREATWRRPLL
ncbi:helix-turn-helix domain-containing protein [Streptomyces zaomyceticus]|uniref:helix-turn-helix domain-containing protein n=1 Tax=Streptomyces zaomyceticus TaxID=68286 RepID=UPI00371D7403